MASPARFDSIRLRAPLVLTLLVVLVLVVSLWAVNRELERSALEGATERTQTAADQIALAMSQGVTRGLGEVQRLVADDLLQRFVSTPSDELRAAVLQRLRPLTGAGQPPVEVWTADGGRLLEVVGPAGPDGSPPVPPSSAAPIGPGLSPFGAAGDTLFFDLVAPINTVASGGAAQRVGLLSLRRRVAPAENFDIVSRLVGDGAKAMLGNQNGSVWSDFSGAVPAPPIDAGRPGAAQYIDTDGETRLGSVSLIESSPWAVWVEFPRSVVLAPARAVVARLALLGTGLVLVATVLVTVLSGRLTRPLVDLTEASEAIAAGDYSKRVTATRRDEMGRLAHAFNTMAGRVQRSHDELEASVRQRTQELQDRVAEIAEANEELESFSYSVSHDLRSPLRHITGFVALLEGAAEQKFGDQERRYVDTIKQAATRMGRLIDDLLAFSRMARATMDKRLVQLNEVAESARREVSEDIGARHIAWAIGPLPEVQADPSMLRLAFVNLLSNAVKYTGPNTEAAISIGARREARETVVFVKDNGVGFDPRYADKLFGVFQRLHSSDEFEGTGIGLANVRRIIHRHGGRVWAEGEPGRGATFYFSLPLPG